MVSTSSSIFIAITMVIAYYILTHFNIQFSTVRISFRNDGQASPAIDQNYTFEISISFCHIFLMVKVTTTTINADNIKIIGMNLSCELILF